MPWQSEISSYRLDGLHLAGVGSAPQMLAQPLGEAAFYPLPCDDNIGGAEGSAGPSGFPAEKHIHLRPLKGDVLGDLYYFASEGAGVGGGVLRVEAQSTIVPSATFEKPRRARPQRTALGPRHLGPGDQVPQIFAPGISDQGASFRYSLALGSFLRRAR